MRSKSVLRGVAVGLLVWAWPIGTQAAVDREKLLKDTGVYGTFAVFKVDGDWWKLDKAARSSAAAEVNAVFQKHAENVATDTYLLRGLSEKADFFVRVHSTEMLHNQNPARGGGPADFNYIPYWGRAKRANTTGRVLGGGGAGETRHNKRFGSPTLLGTIRPLDEILEILAR